tara:strand:- start:52 stop:339 length:288 start_codon:yes stop_codon:yes gene_type:complete
MISESLLQNLFREIDWISARSKVIKTNLNETKNNNLKVRLKNEFFSLVGRLERIHNTSIDILKLSKSDISLSALLVEKCRRIKSEVHKNIELFLT